MHTRLVDLYREEIRHGNVHDKQRVRRLFARCLIETMMERKITDLPMPRFNAKGDHTVRFAPMWRNFSDRELDELLILLRPYFARKENRGLTLD